MSRTGGSGSSGCCCCSPARQPITRSAGSWRGGSSVQGRDFGPWAAVRPRGRIDEPVDVPHRAKDAAEKFAIPERIEAARELLSCAAAVRSTRAGGCPLSKRDAPDLLRSGICEAVRARSCGFVMLAVVVVVGCIDDSGPPASCECSGRGLRVHATWPSICGVLPFDGLWGYQLSISGAEYRAEDLACVSELIASETSTVFEVWFSVAWPAWISSGEEVPINIFFTGHHGRAYGTVSVAAAPGTCQTVEAELLCQGETPDAGPQADSSPLDAPSADAQAGTDAPSPP